MGLFVLTFSLYVISNSNQLFGKKKSAKCVYTKQHAVYVTQLFALYAGKGFLFFHL